MGLAGYVFIGLGDDRPSKKYLLEHRPDLNTITGYEGNN